jgi:2-polyprenyl-3-methyl-5-hydroxy-6-metoxy-1,4-benzoquinol methylase
MPALKNIIKQLPPFNRFIQGRDRLLEEVSELKKERDRLLHRTLAGDEPRMAIEEITSEHNLQRLFQHIQDTWQQLGETEPHWSVASAERFRQSSIQNTLDEFYARGKRLVQRFFCCLDRNDVDYTAFKSCLEYGCGLGRVTRWLSEKFETVYGYDISLSHLQYAGNYLTEVGISNVTLQHLKCLQDIEKLPKVDAIYSIIVLQHNPPPVISLIVRSFLRSLNPGGIAFFQVPTYQLGYDFLLEEYLRYLQNKATKHEMECHVLPQRKIFGIVQQEGGQVLEVLEDGWMGFGYKQVSNSFLIQKRME